MDGSKVERSAFSRGWNRKIGATLPNDLAGGFAPNGEKLKRILTTPAHRAAFAQSIEKSIGQWFKINPEIAPHRQKLTRLATEAGKLQDALKLIRRIKGAVAKLGADPGLGMNIYTAQRDLYAVANRAASEMSNLATWNLLWRPKKARPPSFPVALTRRLRDDYRLFCGHVEGFDGLLTVIQQMHHEYPDLPELIYASLKKQEQRERAKRKQRAK